MFCENNVVTTKIIKVYPKNKVWSHIKIRCLSKKRAAFVWGHTALFKEKKRLIKRSRQQQGHKMEKQLITGDGNKAWSSLNAMTDREVWTQHCLPT